MERVKFKTVGFGMLCTLLTSNNNIVIVILVCKQ